MAGDYAAASQQQAAASIGYYNLLIGPTAWRFSSSLGMEFTDNARLVAGAKESDFILRPAVNAQMHWPVTLKNSLDVTLSVGYAEYIEHQELSRYFINPGSGVSFDIYIGDWKLNLHDRLTISESTYQDSGSGGNRNEANLENTIGATLFGDLNKATVGIGYDHVTRNALASESNQPDSSSENVNVFAGIRVRPQLLLGLEAGGSTIEYQTTGSQSNQVTSPNVFQWHMGAFASATVTENISTRVDAGYTALTTENGTTNLLVSDQDGFYFGISISHRVNKYLNYTINAGRRTDASAYGQVQAYTYVQLQPNWLIFKKTTLSTPFAWRQGNRVLNEQNGGTGDYQQFIFSVNLSRPLTKKLSGSAYYQFVKEISAEDTLNFTANTVGLNLNYQF